MTTFGLVHGAYHGGWCWERLAEALEARGFDAVAPDLPCDDPDAGLDVYATTVVDALAGHDDVILVGHSLGSLTIPLVAGRRPVRRLVFLCSVPTGPGPAVAGSMASMVRPEFLAAPRYHDAAGRELLDNRSAQKLFYHDCSDDDARWAISQLRPQAPRPLTEPSPLEAWPDVPQSVVLTTDDRVVEPGWAVPAARQRLGGVDPLLLPGSHSPFLSRPSDLADLLIGEARR